MLRNKKINTKKNCKKLVKQNLMRKFNEVRKILKARLKAF